MKLLNRTKMLIKASVVIAIALAFVLPVTALTSQTQFVAFSEPKNIMGRGEWIEQASGFATASRGIKFLDAVDNDTAWATGYDGSGGGVQITEMTMTTNGGALWTPSQVLGATGYGLGNICGLSGTVAYTSVFSDGAQDSVCGPYKTTNGGATWTQLGVWSTPMSFCNSVWFWDENDGVVLGDADTYFDDYYTSDGGATWTRVPLANFSGLPFQSGDHGWTGVMDAVGDTVVFGTGEGNAIISHDRGHTWYSAYTGASTSGTNPGVNDLAFKDDMHGLAAHDNGASYSLYETSDGGVTWTPVSYTGICYGAGLAYLPGTTNKYVSTGAASGSSGASYSVDGGHSWTDYAAQAGIQMLAVDFVAGEYGWAGAFNDESTGGMFKHFPSENPLPAFSVSVVGGKGFTVKVANSGEATATDVTCDIAITGGLFITPKTFSGNQTTLAIGANFTVAGAPKGIGLGIIKPQPTITITISCDEGVNATKIVQAKIFLTRVILQ